MGKVTRWLAGLLCLASGVSLAQGVEVSQAWARATAPGQTVGAVYLTLKSRRAAKLIEVRSPVAERVEIHASSMEDGTMRMRMLEALPLSAGETVTLAPMGTHLMLIDLKSPLKAGGAVPLELVIQEKGRRRTLHIKAVVRAPSQPR